jgi:hypothetical protein
MKQWLLGRTTPSIQVEVGNPVYQTVTVKVTVKLAASQPEAAGKKQLNTDLQAYLSPWVFQQPKHEGPPKMSFQLAEIRHFVRTLAYVTEVKDLSATLSEDGGGPVTPPKDSELLSPSNPWNFLITAEQHVISIGP